MHDFTQHWHWPQWVMLIHMFLGWAIVSSQHGNEMLIKGKPARYSAFVALSRFVLMLFLLICGGFFA